MKKRLLVSILLILALVLTLASCRNKKIEGIEIVSGTAPTEVYVDEQPDFSGMKLLVKYNDGSSVEISAADATIGEIDTSKPGKVSYSIAYEGFTVSASITVKAKIIGDDPITNEVTLTGITYLSGLNTTLFVGGELDTTVLKVTATYSDGSTKTIDSKNLTTNITEFDKFQVGTQTLVITYEGKTCEVTITVQAIEIVDFTIDYSTIDTSKTYYVGDTVDTSKLVGKAQYNNGTTKDLANSDFTFSAIDNTTAGEKTLTVTYSGISKTIDFTFNAVAPTSLTHASGSIPNVVYGDQPDTSAIKAILKYNNGKTEELNTTQLAFTEIDTSVPGSQSLKVSYGNYSFNVAYTVLDITAVEVTGVSNEVKINTDIDCANIRLKLTLSDGTTKYVTEGVTVDKSAFSSTELGKTSITANYKNETVQFEIDVVEIVGDATLHSIEITEGVVSQIYEGQSFSALGIKLLAKFSDNQTLNLDYSDVTIEGTVGATVGTHTLTIKFTYEGVTKSCTHTVEVIEVKVTKLVVSLDEVRVERNPFGHQPNLENLTAIAYYNDGSQKNLTLSNLTVGTIDVSVTGETTLTVTYEEGADTVKVIVVEPTVTDVKIIGTYSNTHIVGETYDASGVIAEVYYSNGEKLNKTDAGVVFNAETGVLSVTFGNKSATKSITLLTITSVIIDTETFNTAPSVGEFSTDGLKLIVYLSDGSNVIRNADTINTDNVNANASGTYTITATYLGKTSASVEILVLNADGYVITGSAFPESIALWKGSTLQANFLDKGYRYAVGDDNPFKFELMLTYRDKVTDKPLTKYIAYRGVSKVYDMNGNEVGTDIVVIDDVNHTFDFTEAAIGNCYKITTRPENITAGAEVLFTKELVVEIVDGFNVHDEMELNVLTNYGGIDLLANIANGNETTGKTIGNSNYEQLKVVYNFMKNNVDFVRDMSLTEYVNFVNGIKGVVLHDFLTPAVTDFPTEYFFISGGQYYLWDHFAMYYREFTQAGTFNLYGNYFQIDTNAIPCVAQPGSIQDGANRLETNNAADDPTSNSEIFRFHVADAILNAAAANNTYDHTAYKANFYALAMSDNDKSIAEQTEAERVRSTLGAYAFKLAKAEYTFHSVNIQRYYISVMNEYDCLTVNYDYCTFFDSWNNHISIWSANTIDEKDGSGNLSMHEGHTNIKVNITNSFIAKSGGPVIISSAASPKEEFNAQSGADVTIDDKSVLYSYVTGEESWFVNYSATSIVGGIKQISDFLLQPNGAQFTTNITSSGKDFINMIYLNLSSAALAGLEDDIDGSLKIGEKLLVDMSDTSVYQHPVTGDVLSGNYGDAYVDTVRLGAKLLESPAMPPIFKSSDGGFTMYDGTKLDKTMGPAFTGNLLTMYYENMGLLMGYNEKTIEKEPTQRENESIVRITEAHGYN